MNKRGPTVWMENLEQKNQVVYETIFIYFAKPNSEQIALDTFPNFQSHLDKVGEKMPVLWESLTKEAPHRAVLSQELRTSDWPSHSFF